MITVMTLVKCNFSPGGSKISDEGGVKLNKTMNGLFLK